MKTNNEVDGRVLEAAKRFEKALADKPVEEQIAVGLISKNVINGCSWEFVNKNAIIKENYEAFKNSNTCSINEVTYNHQKGVTGYLIYIKMDRLLELLGPANCGPLVQKDVEYAEKHRKEAGESLIKKIQKGYSGMIGIYCTNDSQTITVSGKSYPAYAVTLKEL